jgi:hypothetical protein
MANYVTLLGTEQVQSAANRMVEAAESMRHAASIMDDILERHHRFMDDWLMRFEDAMRPPNTTHGRGGGGSPGPVGDS